MQRQQRIARTVPPSTPEWIQRLHLAADQFIVARADASGALSGKTVIAGYPWFSDWGRDTMIALPGLTLATGRHAEAAAILRTFARTRERGHAPESLSRRRRSARIQHRRCDALVLPRDRLPISTPPATSRCWPGCYRCCATSSPGTSAARATASSWIQRMGCCAQGARRSAHLDGREGRRLGGHTAHRQAGGDQRAMAFRAIAPWRAGMNCSRTAPPLAGLRTLPIAFATLSVRASGTRTRRRLFDVIDGPDALPDASVRPNQIFAVSLDAALLFEEQARSVVERVRTAAAHARRLAVARARRRALRAPLSRRSGGARWRLSPGHGVELAARSLRARTPRCVRRCRARARTARALAAPHLDDACLGQVSEIFDGEAPHVPGGCCRAGVGSRRNVARLRPSECGARQLQLKRSGKLTMADRNSEKSASRENGAAWKQWGPYLSERQWGTVREDYSAHGNAWDHFPHDHARSRAYRWGEDGIAGFSDDQQRLCLSACALERKRSDSEGTAVRPHQQRGQPRRGRQGAVLLPRRHAHAFLSEDALQVSAGRVSLCGPGGREPPPRHRRRRVRAASTPACSTTIATSMCSWSTRKPIRTTSSCGSRPQSRPESMRRSICCRRSGFRNTWSWKPGDGQSLPCD